jgi:hypothetical protein
LDEEEFWFPLKLWAPVGSKQLQKIKYRDDPAVSVEDAVFVPMRKNEADKAFPFFLVPISKLL